MVIRICLISTMFIFFTAVSNKHEGNFNQKRITVIGKAVVMKHYAAVRTDDSVFYFLDGKYKLLQYPCWEVYVIEDPLAEIIKIKEICLLIQKEFGYKLFPRPHSASVLDQIK